MNKLKNNAYYWVRWKADKEDGKWVIAQYCNALGLGLAGSEEYAKVGNYEIGPEVQRGDHAIMCSVLNEIEEFTSDRTHEECDGRMFGPFSLASETAGWGETYVCWENLHVLAKELRNQLNREDDHNE